MEDIVQEIALSADSLDQVIDFSLTSSQINDRLKNLNSINIIKRRLGITRPTVDEVLCDNSHCVSPWDDVIRENSKIHATKYARLDISTSDYPSITTIIRNVLRENMYVNRYAKYITSADIGYATDTDVTDVLLPQFTTSRINVQGTDKNGKFSPQIFLHYIDVIIPKYHLTGIGINLEPAIINLLSQDVPLDSIFQSIILNDNTYTCTTYEGNIIHLSIPQMYIGPNNFKYIRPDVYSILFNPYTSMVVKLVQDGSILLNSTNINYAVAAQTINGVRPGLDVIEYYCQHNDDIPFDKLIMMAVISNNLHIAQYLSSLAPHPPRVIFYRNYTPMKGNPVSVDDIEIIYRMYGDDIYKIIQYIDIDTTDDQPDVYLWLVGKVSSSYFNNPKLWSKLIANDNIRCLTVVRGQCTPTNQMLITQMLSEGQLLRLNYWK